MSVLCPKCNAAVPEGAQFCGSCGAPVGSQSSQPSSGYTPVNLPPQTAPGTAPPPPPAAATPPLPGYTQVHASGQAPPSPPSAPPYAAAGAPVPSMPPPPAQSGGGSALKIVLIVLAIFVGLGIVGAGAFGYMVWRVSHAIRAAAVSSSAPDGASGSVTMNTPAGAITTGPATSFTAEELGTDIYPGAKSIKGGMRMNLPTGFMTTGVFVTSDSKEAVRDFYKGKLGSDTSVFESDDAAVLTAKRGEEESVMVTISARQAEADGKTRIVIVHTKATKPS